MVLDLAGEELVSGSVVLFPAPGGMETRGFVWACLDESGEVIVAIPGTRTRQKVLAANCALQHGPTGRVLVCIERAGTLNGFAEVEAA